ncbi:FKBP-type peptidyl-prolyl cis-trans isomerase [Spiractinospora alimapuensis]|uniref:FKBP-type peptidyl-prolyl cis-trans isomerase n=1 Tax=Spiractinospora alimapuensis TaxID=2820884 RepID=UPI001F478BC5|nr:FKBP-type peptidyl-prolyl cis-trans isomerase [Spiractinospora alimapuensis]QVQ52519.1 FKBP-type peptidyl-prolyl cis-trans isomerase [Spiractinospora alimapuensis]
MRRPTAVLPAVSCAVALLAVSGCGVDSHIFKPWWMRDAAAEQLPAVSGDFGEQPELEWDSEDPPPEETLSLTAIEGEEGDGIEAGDVIVTNVASWAWTGPGEHMEETSTYESETPMVLELIPEDQETNDCLGDATVGSRVVCAFPPPEQDPMMAQGGPMPASVVVFDIEGHYPSGSTVDAEQTNDAGGDLPTVTETDDAGPEISIPDADAPEDLEVEVLAEGDGPEVEAEQQLVLQYTGVMWNNGEVFDSTWDPEGRDGAPIAQFQIGVGAVIEGWDEGLVGQRVGSRVLLVIPPDMAYGDEDEVDDPEAPSGPLVFVVDILDAVDPQPTPEPEPGMEGMEGMEDLNLEDLEGMEEAPEDSEEE